MGCHLGVEGGAPAQVVSLLVLQRGLNINIYTVYTTANQLPPIVPHACPDHLVWPLHCWLTFCWAPTPDPAHPAHSQRETPPVVSVPPPALPPVFFLSAVLSTPNNLAALTSLFTPSLCFLLLFTGHSCLLARCVSCKIQNSSVCDSALLQNS